MNQIIKLKVREHEVVLEDSVWPSLIDTDPVKFISIQDYTLEKEVSPDLPGMFLVMLEKDSLIDQHNRRVLNILEVTGILGGIFEIFEIGFGFLLGVYASYVFKREMYLDILNAQNKYLKLEDSINKLEEKIENYKAPDSQDEESEEEGKSNYNEEEKQNTQKEGIKKINDDEENKELSLK